MIYGVPYDQIDEIWPDAAEFVQMALDETEGEESLVDIEMAVREKQMQLWIIVESQRLVGALTTKVIDYGNMRACRFVTLGGDFDGDFDLIESTVSDWAESVGCDRTEIIGRPGWARALKKHGYKQAYAYVTKRLV